MRAAGQHPRTGYKIVPLDVGGVFLPKYADTERDFDAEVLNNLQLWSNGSSHRPRRRARDGRGDRSTSAGSRVPVKIPPAMQHMSQAVPGQVRALRRTSRLCRRTRHAALATGLASPLEFLQSGSVLVRGSPRDEEGGTGDVRPDLRNRS